MDDILLEPSFGMISVKVVSSTNLWRRHKVKRRHRYQWPVYIQHGGVYCCGHGHPVYYPAISTLQFFRWGLTWLCLKNSWRCARPTLPYGSAGTAMTSLY